MTDQPRMGRPDSSVTPGPIRSGSPFAPGSDSATPPASGSGGLSGSTASGALLASTLVLFFAATSAWLFPLGGCLVSPLGVVLALLGLRSGRRRIAGTLAIFHAALFATSLIRL